MEFKEIKLSYAEAHTVVVFTLVLPCTLVTMATIMMQGIGREVKW